MLIPARVKGRERTTFVDDLVERLMTQRPQNSTGDASLEERAQDLADRYNDGVTPSSVRWVKNQQARWASCSPASQGDPTLQSPAPVPGVGDRRGARA